MVEFVPSNDSDLQRRRSTRVVQAIPITVEGVDALGQAFKERTSTVFISCHGCKYQSKHYVPKDSDVTLEIPRAESGQPPRSVRAKIVWVQRPKTVRELFQVGIELYEPGNVWGIAFPPKDWLSVPAEGPVIPLPAAGTAPAAPAIGGQTESTNAAPSAPATDSKVHMLPGPPRSEMAMAMARQMARLLAQSKQHLDKAIQEGTTAAVAKEIRAVREQIDAHLRGAVEKAVETALAKVTDQTVQQAVEQLLATTPAAPQAAPVAVEEIRALREQFDAGLHEAVEKAVEASLGKVAERAAQQLLLTRATESSGAPLARPEQPLIEDATRRLEEVAAWPLTEWRKQVEESLAAAGQKSLKEFQAELERGAAGLQKGLEAQRLSLEEERRRADASLGVSQQAIAHAEESATRLEAAAQSTLEEARKRLEAMLAAEAAEFDRRTESLVAEKTRQLEPTLKGITQKVLGGFDGEVDRKLAPHLERAQQAVSALVSMQGQADEVVRGLGKRLNADSDQIVRELLERMKQQTAEYPVEFEQACRAALAKVEEELDAKSSDATHTTFEALYKASEWYQKKAQTTMQASLEKFLEQFTTNLQERAAEVSRLFGAELDHYSRNYAEHTRNLIEETNREASERVRGQLQQMAETAAASFADELHRAAGGTLERLRQEARQESEKAGEEIAVASEQASAALEAQHQKSIAEFQARLNHQIDLGVAQARQFLEAQLLPLVETWKEQRDAEQGEWLEQLRSASNTAIEEYKVRLENASNSWLLASATTLGQHSQAVLETLGRAAEQRLRETCAQVFAGLGETLRQRLLGLSSEVQPGTTPPERKQS